MKKLLAILLGIFVAQPAAAAPDLKNMHGLWEGSIGALPVRACYDSGAYVSSGKYYYLKHLATIPLIADGDRPGELSEGWGETAGVARWRMTSISPDRVEGTWIGKGRPLPIRLNRLQAKPDPEFDSPCGSAAFFDPIFVATRLVKSKAAIGGVAVERWSLASPGDSVSVDSFQLTGSGAANTSINRHLREPFDEAEGGWKWCLRNAGAFGGYYQALIEARLVSARWLSVVETYGDFCGGAHPNDSSRPILFDRASGGIVNLLDWFTPANVSRDSDGELVSPAGDLAKTVLKAHPRTRDEECSDPVTTATGWLLELRATGIAFSPALPRVVMACADEVELTWATLAPFFNATGKREVAALRRSGPRTISPVRRP